MERAPRVQRDRTERRPLVQDPHDSIPRWLLDQLQWPRGMKSKKRTRKMRQVPSETQHCDSRRAAGLPATEPLASAHCCDQCARASLGSAQSRGSSHSSSSQSESCDEGLPPASTVTAVQVEALHVRNPRAARGGSPREGKKIVPATAPPNPPTSFGWERTVA